ncbi:MAG: glutathione S-transferase family protein [Candidatus Pelagadaptatus aseana]|uniref:glutathione S-transferase family protein n=1 Tax=Candidatus Pelagadaptatus aseana TaxID=3120508 RepID=UPI0039B1B10A
MKLWHCHNARSLRALWAMEEMGFDYELEILPFPPRVFKKEYLDVNTLGTVPYFQDGKVTMTESSGIPLYLVERYQKYDLGLRPQDPEYGDYLNWLFHSDATLTFPQTVFIRFVIQEPDKKEAGMAYMKWFHARLRKLEAHLSDGRDYLVGNKFTIADIDIAYALYLGRILKCDGDYAPVVKDYLDRMIARPAFQRVVVLGEAESNFK